MDNIHVLERIHLGKCSTVHKGKRKGMVKKFIALKSFDKPYESKVAQEVKIHQSLDHSNVVQLNDWCETSTQGWLVLEYCAEGDLRRLLEQESSLPEDEVHGVAWDVVRGLRYLHSKGIIHCDLKPSNILFDGNGTAKLCDFGLSREISQTPSSSLVPQANKRGTPCYMAPELFDDGGVHSYASDLWALGCVLYECYAGRPPFIGEELTQLTKSIITDPTPSLPGNPSLPFIHLVNGLLVKDPRNRIQWSEIYTHAFWGTDKLSSVDLPPQPAFDNTIQLLETSEGLNLRLVRLSRVAKSNLQKEKEKEQDESDVKIENRDMELDFTEYTEREDVKIESNLSSNQEHIHEAEVSVAKTQRRRLSPLDVLWHDSDLYAIPVIPLPSKQSVPPSLSSLEAYPSADFVKLPKDKLDDLTNSIVTTLNGKTPIREKKKVMRYLEMLSTNWDAAQILSNSPIMPLLVQLLQQYKGKGLSVCLVSLIGLLVHYSTSINDDLSNSGILDTLKEVVEDDREEKEFRRLSMAALGELLYYISATQDHLTNPPESPSKEKKASSGWQVPDTFISLLTCIVSTGEDKVTQLYALQTMKNMSSYGGNWSACFTTEDVINKLCDIFQDPNKEETFRLTAGSCLVQLVCFKVSIIPLVMEKLSFKKVAKGITKDNPKEQIICLNLLNVSILSPEFQGSRHLNPLWKVKKLVPSVVSLVANGGEVVRGKILLFVKLLCKKRRRWVSNFFLDGKLVSSLDTLVAKEEVGVYMRQCLEVFLEGLVAVIPEILESVVDHVEQLIVGTTTKKSSKTYIQHLDLVLILAPSRAFKLKVVNSQELLQQLKRLLIILVENQFEGRDDFQYGVVSLYSAITQDASLIQNNPMSFVHDILPSVSIIYRGSQIGKVRFSCFKIWFQLVLDLLNKSSSEEFRPICHEHLLPLYPQLLKDSVQLSQYAQKLHDVLVEYDVI